MSAPLESPASDRKSYAFPLPVRVGCERRDVELVLTAR